MATATETRQFVSIIDTEKISKSKAIQNLNNNNPVGNSGCNRRPRNDSINYPSWLYTTGSPLDEIANSFDCLVNDCMWNQTGDIHDSDIDAFISSFSNSEDDAHNGNSSSTHQSNTSAYSIVILYS